MADDSGNATAAYLLGNPEGLPVEVGGDTYPRGLGWTDESVPATLVPKAFGSYLESTLVDKLNELIGQFNQFKSDYNSLVVPTTASDVDPLEV